MPIDRENEPVERTTSGLADNRKIYTKPEILYELELEAQAGSPLNVDPFGLNPNP